MKNWKCIEGAKTGNKQPFDDFVKKLAEEKPDLFWSLWNAGKMDALKAYYEKITGEKVGNETLHEYATSKPRVINEDKTGAEEFFKQLSDDVKEREEKDDADIEKVGNANLETSVEKGKLGLWNWYVHKDGTIVSGGTSSTETNAKEMARKALEKEKAGNKVGNIKFASDYYDIQQESNGKFYIYVNGGAKTYGPMNSEAEAKAELQRILSQRNKTGNKTYKVKESSGHDGGYDYGYIVVDESNKSVGRTFSTRSEAEEYIRELYKKEKVGNVDPILQGKKESDLKNVVYTVRSNKAPEKKFKSRAEAAKYADSLVEQGHFGVHAQKEFDLGAMRYAIDVNLRAPATVDNKRTGNSAQDDKFAYVMREFDEGKLKTPDGKVVTDPSQAKAIAYSESKKTENGLARARKAMNAWNSERKIEPVGKYREFIDNLKNAIELGVAGVLYNSLDEQTVKEWVEKAKKEGYGSHISGVQGKKVILK